MSARGRLLHAAALGAAAFAVGALSSSERGRELDSELFDAVNASGGSAMEAFTRGVTELGSLYAVGAAAAALASAGRRREAGRALAASGATWLAAQGLKKAFGRPRPYHAREEGEVRRMIAPPLGSSWPSGHPAVLLAFLTVAGRELGLRRASRAALLGIAGAVGVSRTHLGVHYPSDVAGGLLLGRAVGVAWPGRTPRRR